MKMRFFADARRRRPGYYLARFLLILLMALTFFPFVLLFLMSLKLDIMIRVDFFGLPNPVQWSNYTKGFSEIIRPIFNSLIIAAASLVGILTLVSLSGFAFGRYRFKGRGILFGMVLMVMMIPHCLTIIPVFTIVNNLQLIGSRWALILPYVAGQQILGVILLTSFYSSLPEEMFEAARIEGANELFAFLRIGLPLSVPTLITVGITSVVAMYNDYIWPTLVVTKVTQKTFAQAVFAVATGNGAVNYGVMSAVYVIGTIPLLLLTLSCLRYYLQGMLEGAIKG
jgi:ABC-type glycerol-3-phosphate transport system permease component